MIATTRPPPALLHRRHGGLAHRDDRQQIQIERRRIGVDGRRGKGSRRWPTSIRNQDVDRAECLSGIVDETSRTVGGRHVGNDRYTTMTDRLRGRRQAVGISAADRHVDAFGREGDRRCQAESGCGCRHGGAPTADAEFHVITV